MFKKLFSYKVGIFGYEIARVKPMAKTGLYEIYKYQGSDGNFDYEAYRRVQTDGNKRKIEKVWVREENIRFLADYIRQVMDNPTFCLCHGTRRGKEQEWFRKYLGCEVLGTEISDTATQFPHTIQWDFHDVKPEWLDSVDFIYSNAFDHSFDPRRCLRAWMSCLRPGGLCILEHSSDHEPASELDPFGAPIALMPYLILSWGEGEFFCTQVLTAPSTPDSLSYLQYLIVRRAVTLPLKSETATA